MKYWQITTHRLSKAAQKLSMDEQWHPFESTPHAWYRVTGKKLVQRVNFADSDEERTLLPLVQDLTPLESMGRTGGFREQMEIRIQDDRFAMIASLGYAPEEPARLQRAFQSTGMSLDIQGNLASVLIPIETLDHDTLMEARERLVLARELYEANR